MAEFRIGKDDLCVELLEAFAQGKAELALPDKTRKRVEKGRKRLLDRLEDSSRPIYGVNTGFGSLCETVIPEDRLQDLQRNLILSHACGIGDPLPCRIVRLMLSFKVIGLSKGNSGVRPELIERLCFLYQQDMLPAIPEKGSLGASGDLAPLAHLSLPVIGSGEVFFHHRRMPTGKAMVEYGLQPLQLEAKEGLALLNGTQFMSAIGGEVLTRLQRLSKVADRVAALSITAFGGSSDPFHPEIHELRPHPGQGKVAEHIRTLLEEQDPGWESDRVQDPYSFRCIPQVHGSSLDVMEEVSQLILREVEALTDNPILLDQDDRILSAGNFHGQPLAMAFDRLAVAMAEWGSISERRTYKLLSGTEELPEFLVPEPGLNSGLMIPQYVAASLVSQNRQLAAPASIDSIDSSNGQEDHVSMGANAATRLLRMLENLEGIWAIEWLTAAQAIDLREGHVLKGELSDLYGSLREKVPFADGDRPFYKDIDAARQQLDVGSA